MAVVLWFWVSGAVALNATETQTVIDAPGARTVVGGVVGPAGQVVPVAATPHTIVRLYWAAGPPARVIVPEVRMIDDVPPFDSVSVVAAEVPG